MLPFAPMLKNLWYTGAPLDRVSHLREDAAWVAARRRAKDTRLVPVWRSRSLVHTEDDRALILTVEEAGELLYDQGPTVVISGGWHHPASFPFSMEFTIVCEGGTLDYRSANPGLRLYAADGTASEVALPEQDGFEAELQAFVDACRSGKPSEACPPEESAQAVAMTLAMRQSRSLGGGEVPTG